MDDALVDSDTLSLSRKSILPGAGFFHPDSLEAERAEQEVQEALDGADALVIADPDADGLGCVALIRHVTDGSVGLVPTGPNDLSETLARVATHLDALDALYVCDLCPDSIEAVAEPVETFLERTASVRWFDHHEWDAETAESVRSAGVDLVVGPSDEECSTDVTLRSLEPNLPMHLQELAAVTRDHDLWIREDPRSDDLADYSYWSDPEEYVGVVLEHGPDLPEDVRAYLEDRRVEKEALIDKAVERASFHEIGELEVAATYGRCSQNEVAEELRKQGADAAVIVKPAGSASIRGTDAFERCHEVARQVSGGGHPRAAGCKPDIYDDMLDYAHHWTTRGAVTKQTILDAFRTLVGDRSSAPDVEGDEE
jgi:oligoribonuclease NrnB/cAMP/cGMP phosphodiesterase (DHH superfamily)